MKTLLFCTSYADSKTAWNGRYKSWYDYYSNSKVNHDQIVIFDDASPVEPDFCKEGEYFRFSPHLGRQAHLDYGGWYRSFAMAAKYAQENGFDKIIHAESDAYLLSDKIIDFVNSLNSGWHTFWCTRHNLHESALQVICSDQIKAYRDFTDKPYDVYRHQLIDKIFPYTGIHTIFQGDRYGEYLDRIPSTADFSCQTSVEMINGWKEKASLSK